MYLVDRVYSYDQGYAVDRVYDLSTWLTRQRTPRRVDN